MRASAVSKRRSTLVYRTDFAPRTKLPLLTCESLDVRDASLQALPDQHGEPYLHHVQPRAVHGRADELDLLGQTPRPLRGEALVEGGRGVRVEVVYHQADPARVRVEIVCEVAHHLGELRLSAMLGHPRFSVALGRLEGHEHMGRTPALVLG